MPPEKKKSHRMQLAVDIGNSYSKAALFDKDTLLEIIYFDENEQKDLQNLFIKRGKPSAALVASVKPLPESFIPNLSSICHTELLHAGLSLPFQVGYTSPQTLGPDRLAAVAAAFNRFPGRNVLVIDIGTCITYDLLLADGLYKGGSISPGLGMRFMAMNQFTGKLPLASLEADVALTGIDTTTSLQAGVYWGVKAEMEGIIGEYQHIYKDLTVLMGGGDNKYFDKKFRISIFAASNLVIEGLKVIMDYNQIG